MVSNEGRILGIIKPTIEYDIPTTSNTALRARTEMTTEGPDSNLITILKDRTSSSELSNVLENFKSIAVNNNDNVEEPQSKKSKRNKYHYRKDITHGFQSSIASNKKMDIIKYMQLLT